MLAELRVENLLLIERAELALDPGLNVITGETGAGKTMLAHALDLLLGGKPRRGIIRPGATEAYVEGVFACGDRLADDPELAELRERIPLGDELVLARRATAEGRTRAYIEGRSASAADLRAVGARLLAFYGQHEHRKLMLASAQLDVLDAFCGEDHIDRRLEHQRGWSRAQALERELQELRERVGARERDLDLLEFEIGEIEEAAPSVAEDEELAAEQARLAAVDSLRAASLGAAAALDPQSDDGLEDGAAGRLSTAESELDRAQGADPGLDALAERCRNLAFEAADLSRELRDYGASLEADPGRLEQVTERLDLIARLRRKHGGTIAAVLEHAERCRAERDRLSSAGETTARLEAELEHAIAELERSSEQLRATRKGAAAALGQAVRAELEHLAMGDASFEVRLCGRENKGEPAGAGRLAHLGPRGADSVEMVIAPNPGVPAGALREVASGGELSRVMLALLSVASAAEGAPTVVFDEVDAGVGGNTARAVGERLRTLAGQRQVVCITHLPQVASLAARHFRVAKSARDGLARADVERLGRSELVGELCRMLGADRGDGVARRHAERLLKAA
jgi:DNA repair protein RecN (Recombination protein N)